jgi:ribosomal protein L29
MSDQKDIYIQLLETQVQDLEQKVEEMKEELLALAHQLANQRIPTLTE